MTKRRVVVTGAGIVSGYGLGVEPFVDGVFSGRSSVTRITHFDASMLPCQIGSRPPEFDAAPYFKAAKDAKRFDTVVVQSVVAAKQAVAHSGLVIDESNAARVGVYVGSGIGGLDSLDENITRGNEKGWDRLLPLFIPNAISNMPAGVISIETGAMGPGFSIVSACASSGHAIGEAMRLIRLGICDAVIAGGTEQALNRTGIGGFCAMRAVTSDFNDTPEKGSRPFDAKRSGFVMGAGSGVLVLESEEHARARGAKILAEIVGYGASCDAFHITSPPPGHAGAQIAMRSALADAEITPDAISYVNAHGTSTEINDVNESKAIREVFGNHADKLLVSSTKSMHGHLLGAAAAVESVACIWAFLRNEAPPTINYEFPDPQCDLNYIPNETVPYTGDYAMCNTFGFGGQNAVLVFRRAE